MNPLLHVLLYVQLYVALLSNLRSPSHANVANYNLYNDVENVAVCRVYVYAQIYLRHVLENLLDRLDQETVTVSYRDGFHL
jgi:hypothetical protein